MSFERVMGLEVVDEDKYQQYREHMLPILKSFGGNFGYDFMVNKVLQSKTPEAINRVFTISFPNKTVMESFFSDERYLAVKAQYFNDSVKSVTTIAMHENKT